MKYYIADTHFDHDNIIRLCDRPFRNVHDMNEHMITMWNTTVKKDDDVYFLGDFAWCSEERHFSRLIGRKHLIKGNHDKGHTLRLKWRSVHEYLELKDGKQTVVLFHYPIYEWNKYHKGSIHFYGHVHGKTIPFPLSSQAYDVGVEKLGYVPRTLDDILNNYKYFPESAPVLVHGSVL